MPAHQRAFIHALAEDYGLDSESQDPEPHRHVCIFKTPRFVSAPKKTLGQCVSLKLAASSSSAAAAAGGGASKLNAAKAQAQALAEKENRSPFNALLLKDPRFGLTIDEVEEGLAGELKKHAAVKVGLLNVKVEFVTRFLASDEVVVIAVPASGSTAVGGSSSSVATGPSPQDKAIETMLTGLRPAVAKTIARLGLASKEVALCRADNASSPAPVITRREGDGPGFGSGSGFDKVATLAGGWSAVAGRGGWRRNNAASASQSAQGQQGATGAPSFASAIAAGCGVTGGVVNLKGRGAISSAGAAPSPGRGFVALLKKKEKRPVVEEPVEEGWLVAAEKEENTGDLDKDQGENDIASGGGRSDKEEAENSDGVAGDNGDNSFSTGRKIDWAEKSGTASENDEVKNKTEDEQIGDTDKDEQGSGNEDNKLSELRGTKDEEVTEKAAGGESTKDGNADGEGHNGQVDNGESVDVPAADVAPAA